MADGCQKDLSDRDFGRTVVTETKLRNRAGFAPLPDEPNDDLPEPFNRPRNSSPHRLQQMNGRNGGGLSWQ